MLRGVHTGLQRSGPRRGVHGGTLVLGAPERLPVHEEGDRVLRLGDAVVRLARRDARRCACNHASGHGPVLHDPAVDVYVVRREVIAERAGCQSRSLRADGSTHSPDVRVLACPGAEGLELALRLAHPCAEEVALAQTLRTRFGVAVDWVEAEQMYLSAIRIP